MRSILLKEAIIVTILLCALAGENISQVPIEEDDIPVSVSTTLLNVPLIVSDQLGNIITGLKKEDFTVELAGVGQKIEFFADNEEPLTVAIVFGVDGCVPVLLDEHKRAAKSFIRNLRDRDEVMITTYGIGVDYLPATNDHTAITREIDRLRWTFTEALHSSQYHAFSEIAKDGFKNIKGRKAILELTDDCRASSVPLRDLLPEFADFNIPVYTVIYRIPTSSLDLLLVHFGYKDLAKEFRKKKYRLSLDDLVKIPWMSDYPLLAQATGGKLFAADATDLDAAFRQIQDELRKQYVVGFYVDGDADEKPRDITITVNRPGVTVRSKGNIRVKAADSKK